MPLPISDEEFERQYNAAVLCGNERLKNEPRALSARYDKRRARVVVELTNGCVFMFPPRLAQGLRDATPENLAQVKVMPYGLALSWPRLNADLTIAGLLAGIFGTKAWMSELGRKGGSRTSEAKAVASRENGRRGGRPRTEKKRA
jgi:Protein of unknown function (DUF2442)